MTIAEELRALAERVTAGGPPAVTLAPARGAGAAEAVTAALTADPTLAERQQRRLGVLAELLRRLTPLARQIAVAIESGQLAAAGSGQAGLFDAVTTECGRLLQPAPKSCSAHSPSGRPGCAA